MNVRQLLRNAASTYGRVAVGFLTALLLTPLVVHRLGPDGFGLWSVALAIGGYFGLADLGVTTASIRYIARERALKDWPALNRTIGAALTFYLGLSALTVVVTAGLALVVPAIFHVSASRIFEFRILILNIGLITVLGFVSVLPIQCVLAAQRLDMWNAANFLLQISIAALTAIGLLAGGGLLLLAGLQLVTSIMGLFFGFILARRFLPEARFRPRWNQAEGRRLVGFAGAVVLMTGAARLIYSSDTVVIGAFLSVGAIAPFALGLRGITLMQALVNAGAAGIGPFASEQDALGNTHQLVLLWFVTSRWAIAVLLPLTALFAGFGGDLITAWVGPGFAAGGAVLAILAVGHLFDLANSGGFQVLLNMGRHRPLAAVMGIEAAVNLGLSILLIKPFGIAGVAVGTTVPLALRGIFFYPPYLSHITRTPLPIYLRQAVLPGIKASLPAVLIVLAYAVLPLPRTRYPIIGLVISTGLAALGGGYLWCLTDANRATIRAAARRFKNPQRRTRFERDEP